MNEHTTGREYYGRSSNLALLGQLFAHARSNFPAGGNRKIGQQSDLFTTSDTSERSTLNSRVNSSCYAVESEVNKRSPLGLDRLSIFNLLYDDESHLLLNRIQSCPMSRAAKRINRVICLRKWSPITIQTKLRMNPWA